jgi:soluble lytic murein transglycosylase-like protein
MGGLFPSLPPGAQKALSSALTGDWHQAMKELPKASLPYLGDYAAASAKYHIPVPALIAQDQVESNFNPLAYNQGSGAAGLGQLTPANQAAFGVNNPYDPFQAIMGQAVLDRQLLDTFSGSFPAMFAAYNEGAGGYQAHGAAGTEPGYLDKIGAALQGLVNSGVQVDVTVRVLDAAGRVMPSTSTIKKAPSTAHAHQPGSRR